MSRLHSKRGPIRRLWRSIWDWKPSYRISFKFWTDLSSFVKIGLPTFSRAVEEERNEHFQAMSMDQSVEAAIEWASGTTAITLLTFYRISNDAELASLIVNVSWTRFLKKKWYHPKVYAPASHYYQRIIISIIIYHALFMSNLSLSLPIHLFLFLFFSFSSF